MAKRSSKKNKRKRVTSEQVKQNAKAGAGSGKNWFDLPEGVDVWAPEKAGSILIDILPYEVSDKNHPDNIDVGCLWYKRQFAVHHGVGVNEESIICPRSIGKTCPICEEATRLTKKDKEQYEDLIEDLKPQKFVAFNILDPEDEEKVAVFAISYGKFAKTLQKELSEQDEAVLSFYDITDEGKTLKVRFSDATYTGRKYVEATRIDFRDREEMDEDETIERVANLDEMLNVLEYDKINSMFLQVDEEDPDGDVDPEDDEDTPPKKPKKKPAKKKTPPPEDDDEDPDEDPDDEDLDDDDEEETPPPKRPKKKPAKKKTPPPEDDDDDDEDPEDDDDEGETPPPKKPKKKAAKKKTNDDGEECPVENGEFGVTVDKFDECDDCPLWEKCEEAVE